jgi:hypothetical protein
MASAPDAAASGQCVMLCFLGKIVDPSEGAKYASGKTRAVYFSPSASRCSESRIPEIGKPLRPPGRTGCASACRQPCFFTPLDEAANGSTIGGDPNRMQRDFAPMPTIQLPRNCSGRRRLHHSGSGWLARPSPWGTCTSYSLPAFLAYSELGHEQTHAPQQTAPWFDHQTSGEP